MIETPQEQKSEKSFDLPDNEGQKDGVGEELDNLVLQHGPHVSDHRPDSWMKNKKM